MECVSRAAPAWPRPTPAPSLPPTPGLGREWQPVAAAPSHRARLEASGFVSGLAHGQRQPQPEPCAAASLGIILTVFKYKTYKTVNKSTSWGHCNRVLQAGHSGEARGSQGLENKLCSTAGWALPRCRCSFHNSPEVRRARRGRREGERSTASRG